MTLRKTFFTLIAFFALGLASAEAQSAKTVMDHAAAKLKDAGGIKATFVATSYKGATTVVGGTGGTIFVEGGKFKIVSQHSTTWFNGKVQWSLLTDGDEVYVSTPTESELQSMNPYTFVNLYKAGYTLSMESGTYGKQAVFEVRMLAQKKGQNIPEMIVSIDKTTYMPHCIRVRMSSGNWVRIEVGSVSAGQHWADHFFSFQEKDYPDVEVIDLR